MPEEVVSGGSPESSLSSSSSVDTASIAASVISDMETGSDSSSESTQADSAAPAQADAAVQTPPVDPDDFDAVQAEITDSLGRKRANSIPHPRVKTMIEKATRKQIAEVAKELGISKAEAELRLDDVLGAVREKNTKFTEMDSYLSGIREIEDEMQNRPDEFVRRAAAYSPAWKKFADFLDQAANPQGQQRAAVDPNADDPEPQPDHAIKDAQGNVVGHTYSLEGLQKARAWDRRQAAKEAEQRVGDRLKPIEDRFKNEADREKAHRIQQDINTKLDATLAKASKWHGFEENAADILAALKADKSLTLHDAYNHVVFPKLAADRGKMREEILAEINKTPHSTSAATTAAAPKSSGVKDTAAIAREVMKEFGG